MKRQRQRVTIRWDDMVSLYLWHNYGDTGMVSDDRAFAAAARVADFVAETLAVLGDEPTDVGSDEK